MTSFVAMLRSEQGKTSPSFLIAIALAIVVVGGYASWRVLSPNPYKQSELVVRESRRVLNGRVREFQQELREALTRSGLQPAERVSAIEKMAEEAKADIDASTEDARDQLADLDIPLKTHENRARRLVQKAEDAKAMIDARVEEKRRDFSGP